MVDSNNTDNDHNRGGSRKHLSSGKHVKANTLFHVFFYLCLLSSAILGKSILMVLIEDFLSLGELFPPFSLDFDSFHSFFRAWIFRSKVLLALLDFPEPFPLKILEPPLLNLECCLNSTFRLSSSSIRFFLLNASFFSWERLWYSYPEEKHTL